jgi:hypothetical protein
MQKRSDWSGYYCFFLSSWHQPSEQAFTSNRITSTMIACWYLHYFLFAEPFFAVWEEWSHEREFNSEVDTFLPLRSATVCGCSLREGFEGKGQDNRWTDVGCRRVAGCSDLFQFCPMGHCEAMIQPTAANLFLSSTAGHHVEKLISCCGFHFVVLEKPFYEKKHPSFLHHRFAVCLRQ